MVLRFGVIKKPPNLYSTHKLSLLHPYFGEISWVVVHWERLYTNHDKFHYLQKLLITEQQTKKYGRAKGFGFYIYHHR
jgi:hypothetical protein